MVLNRLLKRYHFYPRSPCGERHDTSSLMQCQAKFLSTLSLRRATGFGLARLVACINFYPRSPCGERQEKSLVASRPLRISIHALLAESDYGRINDISRLMKISIHALLAESDMYPSQCRTLARDFYPRSPCGERRNIG